MTRTTWIAIAIAIACGATTSACKGGASPGVGGGTGPAAGKERGPCYGNGTCDQGLVCLSDLCVAPPAADCPAIAEHLGGLLLGNYAPRDERARFLAGVTAECQERKLSRDDGGCLLRAESRQAIGQCPAPLGVGDCKAIVAHLRSLAPKAGADQWLVSAADRLIARCKNEVPSKQLEACVLAATQLDQVETCTW